MMVLAFAPCFRSALVALIPAQQASARISSLSLVFVAALLLHVLVRPYVSPLLNFLEGEPGLIHGWRRK